ncbi:hypothetical protein N9L92_05380 [Saprospiraceae bacterium]|nr:hypothetical protein [Saprospiraceae bacterium]
MKKLLIILISLIPIVSYCQNFSIGGHKGHTVFVGIDNNLEFDYSRIDTITKIEASSGVSVLINSDSQIFTLICRRPIDQFLVTVFSHDKLIDSFKLNSKLIYFKQFGKTKNNLTLESGVQSIEVLQELDSIIVELNVPWIHSQVLGYEITIANDKTIKYHDLNVGAKLDNQDLKKAMMNLKRGDTIEFKHIRARLPYEDGIRPHDMKFICK